MGYYKKDVSEFFPFKRPEHYHRECELNDYDLQHKVYIILQSTHIYSMLIQLAHIMCVSPCACVYVCTTVIHAF